MRQIQPKGILTDVETDELNIIGEILDNLTDKSGEAPPKMIKFYERRIELFNKMTTILNQQTESIKAEIEKLRAENNKWMIENKWIT